MENIDEIKNENLLLKNRITELEERLKKYTSGNNHKKYYEKNKDKIKILLNQQFIIDQIRTKRAMACI